MYVSVTPVEFRDVLDVHVETRPRVRIPTLKVADLDERLRGLLVVDDVQSAVGDASVSTILVSAGRLLDGGIGTKFGRCPAISEGIAAS